MAADDRRAPTMARSIFRTLAATNRLTAQALGFSLEATDGLGQAPNSRVTACASSADMDIVDKTAAAPKSANLLIVGLRSQRYLRTLAT